MKRSGLFPLARLASSLSLFGILLCMHMTFTLAHFLPSDSKGVMYAVYIFYFSGIAIGAVICPLFLPVPTGKNKPLFLSIGFIAFLTVFEFTMRSLGFRLWLNSYAVRGIMAIPEGILTTACYGLFYLSWLRRTAGVKTNRTGRFCSLVLGIALLGSVLVCYYSVPLLEKGIANRDPIKGAEFVFNFIKWSMIVLPGIFAVVSIMTHNEVSDSIDGGVSVKDGFTNDAPQSVKTDRSVIIRLIGMASMFTILNGVLDMRALPLYTDKAVYYPNYLAVAVAVPILGFLAGISINRFIRRFLLPVIILFLLFSCLPLFEDQPHFNVFISTLVSIAHYTAWVVFTTAVVELYSGGFWFYGAATVIFFSVAFAFLSPIIGPLVPDDTKYRVLSIVIAVVFSMLMAFRWLLFPKLPRYRYLRSSANTHGQFHVTPVLKMSNLDEIFAEYELSQREIEVANLLAKEGLRKKEIGEKLCIAPGTAKLHISKIYQKFDVKTRSEFMALFIKGEKN